MKNTPSKDRSVVGIKCKDIERDHLAEVGDEIGEHAGHNNDENTLKNTLPAGHHSLGLLYKVSIEVMFIYIQSIN